MYECIPLCGTLSRKKELGRTRNSEQTVQRTGAFQLVIRHRQATGHAKSTSVSRSGGSGVKPWRLARDSIGSERGKISSEFLVARQKAGVECSQMNTKSMNLICRITNKPVTIKWKEKDTWNRFRITMHGCTGLRKDGCAVDGIPGHPNFRNCPHIS